MKGFKPELKQIHCAGLLNTLCIPVQFAFLTIGIGFFAKGLAIHAEPELEVAVFHHLVIMVDQGSMIIHPERTALWMAPDGILPGAWDLLFS